MTQWEKIKTDYVTSRKTYRELAEKYQISLSTLKVHARCDRWVEAREAYVKKTVEKSLDAISDQQALELTKVQELADGMLEKLSTALSQLELTVIQCKEKGERDDCKWEKTYEQTAPGGMVDRQGLRQLAACLKDLKQVKNIQSSLEKMEQEARIQKLLKEAKEDTAQEITVTMDPSIQDYSN